MARSIFNHLIATLKFTLLLAVILLSLRIGFILYLGIYKGELLGGEEKIITQIFQTLYNGAMYDNRIAALLGIIYFFIGLFGIKVRSDFYDAKPKTPKILAFFAYFCIFILLLAGIGDMLYFSIYGQEFNAILLGLIYDDTAAIFATGLSGEYNISFKLLALGISFIICMLVYKYFIAKENKEALKNAALKISLASLGLILVWLYFINSQFSLNAISLDREIHPVKNEFLKKITPGAWRSLYLVYKGYRLWSKSSFGSFSPRTPDQAVANYFNKSNAKISDLQTLLTKTSHNPTNSPKIRHIFYIISESLGDYAFSKEYDEINLVSELKKLASSPHGAKVDIFYESAHGTIWSLESQITGLYQTGIPLYLKAGVLKTMPTAPAHNFSKAGYLTRFYYGGSGAWRNLYTFSLSQGFNEMIDDASLLSFAKTHQYPEPTSNVWGIWDNILFDYIIDHATKSSKPTFNMIMTTSNHPPFDVPLEKYNISLTKFEQFIKDKGIKSWRAQDLGVLYWYDKQVVKFIKEMSEKIPDSIFVITGDHSNNAPMNVSFNTWHKIPFIIYAPTLKLNKLANSGVHLDIAATLLELATPKGFQYQSFGRAIFSNNPNLKYDSKREFFGFESMGTEDFVFDVNGNIQYIKTTQNKEQAQQKFKDLKNRYEDSRALSWWLYNH